MPPMIPVGWCPGDRTVADTLAMYPGTTAARIFAAAGKPLPAWDGPALGPLTGAVLVHVSFKTWDLAAVQAWVAGKPSGWRLVLTYHHEPEQGTTAGDPTVDVFQSRWAELLAAFADHPWRASGELILAPTYTRYWWQAHPNDLRWLVPGADAYGWDVYDDGAKYRTPADLLTVPRAIAARTGRPYLVPEMGATRAAGDTTGAGRSAWMRAMVDALRADGALAVCWFHRLEWDLAAWPAEQQTWRDLIEQEASMGRWTDLAKWVGPTANQSGAMNRWDGVVIHIAEGSYDGTIAWQKNPSADVSSHFIVAKDGRIAQMVDTNVTAWTQRAGNGEWLSVENEGRLPDALTAEQVEANARILAKAHQVYGVPLQVTDTPATRGLGHHSMGAENGYDWGHPSCPGSAIKAQKAAIVTRAKQIINGEEPDMPLTDAEKDDIATRTMKAVLSATLGKSTTTVAQVLQGLNATIAREGTNPTEMAAALAGLPQPQVDSDALAAALAPKLVTALPADSPITDEQLARVLRSVLGSLDATQ